MENIQENWEMFLRELLKEHDEDLDSAAGILLISPENKVLLQLRGPESNNGNTYGTTGGHLVKGESFPEGAKREFYEETSYEGPFKNFQKIGLQKTKKPYVTYIARTDISDASHFKPLPEYEHEVSGYEFFSIDELLDIPNLHPGLETFLQNNFFMDKIKKYVEN